MVFVARRDDLALLGGTRSGLATRRGRDRLTPMAVALSVGAAIGWTWPCISAWGLISLSALCCAAVLVYGRRMPVRISLAMLLIGAALVGAAWPIARHYAVATNDLSRFVSHEPAIARLRGVVTTTPELRQSASGSMAKFNAQPPWLVFAVDVKALVDRHEVAHEVSGAVWVSAPAAIAWIRPGDVVEVTGWMRLPPKPKNPGQFDMWRFARSQNQSALLSVDHPALVRVILSDPSPQMWFTRLRDALRERASGWLHANMPESGSDEKDAQRRAVLTAFLIGERAPELHEVGAAMQRTGLAHIMAISGLHLSMLVGLAMLVGGATSAPRRWHGVAAIALIAGYLLLVEVRVPVLRAGVMLGAASLGMTLGRRVAVGGLVSLSLILMVLHAPAEVTTAGFQLSFGVVYAIIYLSPPLRRRWFGRPDMLAGPTRTMLLEWLKTACAVSVIAWLVATPIVLHHFGIVSPLGAPLSVVGVPATGAVLAVGYLKMLFSAVLPSAGVLLGAVLAWLTDALVWLVLLIDKAPGTSVALPMPSALWTMLTVAWIAAMTMVTAERWLRVRWWLGAVLAAWMLWPLVPVRSEPALRIDMLAVGDGSCYILRSGGETIVFDAGTMGDPGSGTRIIVPAMRALGVLDVDTLIVSHANLDHFSAMLEVVDAFGADELIVTPQFLLEAGEEDSPPAELLRRMREVGVEVVSTVSGTVRDFGDMRMTWLHPPAQASFESANDAAMVIRIECAGRRVLLCGDIQAEAMAMIQSSVPPEELRAEVMELPHHGSFRMEAVAFVEAVDPNVVLQSTGFGRLRRDRWIEHLFDRERLVTARDGACWVQIDHAGTIRSDRFIQPGIEE